jgi:uroporphyrin-3 C-methyltransferase
VLGGLALAVALLAGAGTVYLWQRGENVTREAARRLQQGDERTAQLEMQLKQAQELVRDLQGRSAVLESKLTEAIGHQSQLEQMYKSIAQETFSVTLADVENAVAIASQQLVVSGNVRGALVAMQDADGRLKRINQPEALGLRRLIAADIERLKAVPNIDVVTLALRLDAVASGLGQLPMVSGLSAAQAEEGAGEASGGHAETEPFSFARLASTGRQGWQALLAEIGQLFRVNRVDAPDVALLAPDQRYFVRENLRLTLLSARLALLARAEPLFRADLQRAIEWLETYYDTRERSVTNAVAALRQLQSARISAELPSLGDTLAAVRAARAAREGN